MDDYRFDSLGWYQFERLIQGLLRATYYDGEEAPARDRIRTEPFDLHRFFADL